MLSTTETESLVSKLQTYKIEEIGNERWSLQHEICEKLKFGASMQQSDENKHDQYIINEIILNDKFAIFIKNLLIIEIWKNKIFPIIVNNDQNRKLLNKTSHSSLSTKIYMILYNESVILSIIQMILNNSSNISSYIEDIIDKNEDLMLELIDYFYRKMVKLTIKPNKPNKHKNAEKNTKNRANQHRNTEKQSILIDDISQFEYNYANVHSNTYSSDTEEQKQFEDGNSSSSLINFDKLNFDFKKLEFMICSLCVSSFYLLSQNIGICSLSMIDRILNSNDFINLIVLLIENNPFILKNINDKTRIIYKFQGNNSWTKYDLSDSSSTDHLRLSKLEGQLWLIIYNLLFDVECNKKYASSMLDNQYNKDILLKLKKYLSGSNNILCQQIPVLNQLKRMLEELSIADLSQLSSSSYLESMASTSERSSRGGGAVSNMLQIEIVPQFRNNLLKQCDFGKIASDQINNIFSKYDETQYKSEMKRYMDIYNFDMLENMLPDPKCAQCGQIASKRCSNCKLEWYCSRKCQLMGWKAHKQICSMIKQ